MVNAIKQVNQDIEDKNLGVLGHLVWWSLADVEVLQTDAEALVKVLGLNEKKLCPQIEARGGLVKALESLGLRPSPQSGKKKDPDGDVRYFYDRTTDDDKGFTVSIQERTVDASGNPLYREINSIRYDRKSKTITCAGTLMQAEIEAAFHKYCKTYRSNEVRQIIQRVLESGKAITVRESGGVYFIPSVHAENLEHLRQLGAAINGVSITTLGIVDTSQSRSEMAQAATVEVVREVDTVLKGIEGLEERMKEGQNVRQGTIEARLEDFRAIREKALCYRDLVQMDVEEVEARIKALEERVQNMLVGEAV